MEKLQKALEKAKALRTDAPVPPPRAAEQATGPEIAYVRTRVVPGDPREMTERRIVAHLSGHPLADTFRILRTQVMQKLASTGQRTLAITSPNPGEGKTFTAVNLAASLAMIPAQTVLLVDLDLRRPGVHRCFGITPALGLSDYLMRDIPLADCLINPGIDRLVILPVGTALGASSEILSTAKMQRLTRELRDRYPDRMVVYDLPPLLASDDALVFLQHAEACLLVLEHGVTQVRDIDRSLELLQGARLIGTVLNKAQARARRYRYS